MQLTSRISPCLWFDSQAEEAARFYTSIFPNSKIVRVARYTGAGQEIHGRPTGSVMTVVFELAGQEFMALNGGPIFQFNEAISLIIHCETQQEIDAYWNKLTADGGEEVQCGWLKDRYGLSWQVVPTQMARWCSPDAPDKSDRVMAALMKMKKLDIAALERAYAG